MSGRRTQAERKAATITALVEGAIEVLAERGYSGASVSAICRAAGKSQGALFRHFPTRAAMLAHVASVLGARNVAPFSALAQVPRDEVEAHIPEIVALIRGAARSSTHAAWREIVVAARTDPELREAVGEAVAQLEAAVIDTVDTLFGPDPELRAATTVLSLLHMFDSEAVTVLAKDNPAIEAERIRWAEGVLRSML